MIAGLSSQVVSMAIFAGFCADYAWRERRAANMGSENAMKEKLKGAGTSMGRHWILICCRFSLILVSSSSFGEKYLELTRISFDRCYHYHLHPLMLPCCRTQGWFRRPLGQ